MTENTEFDFDPGDLDLSALTVVSIADSANLPETGASWISAHFGSCSCSVADVNQGA